MSDWTIPTRAQELEEQVAAWFEVLFPDGRPQNAAGEVVDPVPVADAEGVGPRETCPGCGRKVLAMELVDARLIPEHPGDYACGACRGALERSGAVSRAAWVERYGAPADVVASYPGAEGEG